MPVSKTTLEPTSPAVSETELGTNETKMTTQGLADLLAETPSQEEAEESKETEAESVLSQTEVDKDESESASTNDDQSREGDEDTKEGDSSEDATSDSEDNPDTEPEDKENQDDDASEFSEVDIKDLVKDLNDEQLKQVAEEFKIHGIKELQNRINKVTAQRKSAEDKIAALETQLQSQTPSQVVIDNGDPLSQEINASKSLQDLSKLEDKSQDAYDWAEELLNNDDIVDPVTEESYLVEVEGKRYTRAKVLEIKQRANRSLRKLIPARKTLLQNKGQYDAAAVRDFPFLKDSGSELYQKFVAAMNHPDISPVASYVPQINYLLAAAIKGMEGIAKKAETKPKKEVRLKMPSIPKGGQSTSPNQKLHGDVKDPELSKKQIAARQRFNKTGSTKDLAQLL